MSTFPEDKQQQQKDLSLAKVSSLDEKNSASFVDGDSIVEGSEGVTHSELTSLRHVRDKIPFASFLVIVAEFAERCVYIYLQRKTALT